MLNFRKMILHSVLCLGLPILTIQADSGALVQSPANNPMASKIPGKKEHNGDINSQGVLDDCFVMIQNLGNDGIKALKGSKADRSKREEQFLPLFVKNFNIEKIGKFVLGRYGRGSIRPEEFKEFLDIFQKTIVSIYANRLGKYDDEKFVVKEANFKGENKGDERMVSVKSQVLSRDKKPITIEWAIVVTRDGKGIVDVAVEGVSQALTQRDEYADILNNGGIKELIKKLQSKYEKSINPNK